MNEIKTPDHQPQEGRYRYKKSSNRQRGQLRDVNCPGRLDLVQAHAPKDYKQAQDMYERAVELLEYINSRPSFESERAALYYGFMHALSGELNQQENSGCIWEQVAEAARMAAIGCGVKEDPDSGETRVTLVAEDTHACEGC